MIYEPLLAFTSVITRIAEFIMFWIEGVGRNASGLVLETITTQRGREPLALKELCQQLDLAEATGARITTNCAGWQRESGRLFWEKLGIEEQSPKDCHGIFRIDGGHEHYLIPASVFIQAMMRPLNKIHVLLFKPHGLETFCTPLLGNENPSLGINLSRRGLLGSHNLLPNWLIGTYWWMSCFPTAHRMWSSVYLSANCGDLDIELPQATLTMDMTSIKHGDVNLVTKIVISTIEANESPFSFASNPTRKFEVLRNQKATERHKMEILPHGDRWELSDKEWHVISAIITRRMGIKFDMREIIDMILVKLGTGCPWRRLPFGNLNFSIVQNTYHRLSKNGKWEEVKKILNAMRKAEFGSIPYF